MLTFYKSENYTNAYMIAPIPEAIANGAAECRAADWELKAMVGDEAFEISTRAVQME